MVADFHHLEHRRTGFGGAGEEAGAQAVELIPKGTGHE
jgi:hypothetical protein